MSNDLLEPLRAFTRPKKLPKHIDAKTLPALRSAQGDELSADDTVSFIRALAAKHDGSAAIADVMPQLDPESVDAVLATLFEMWGTADYHGRYDWTLEGMAAFGSDRCALAIEPQLEVWPTQSDTGRKRAMRALGTLRGIGTDTALLVLLGMGQKEVLPSVALRGREELELAAKDRGISLGELGDHITPSCGLGEGGRKVFNYGPRQFEVVFDEYFQPCVSDQEGHVGSELPPPEPADDEAAAARAADEWAVMSGQLSSIARVQAARLEDAMVTERRWRRDDWLRYLHAHPLMIHFTRRLVWGLFTGDDDLRLTFRTAEDDTFVDLEDEEVELPEIGRIGIIHPAHLDEASRGTWGDHMADYQIISPFPQFGRTLHAPTGDEANEKSCTRFAGVAAPAKNVRDRFIDLGWSRDESYMRKFYQKYYENGRLKVRVHLDPGIHAGASEWEPDQSLPEITFHHGSSKLPLAKVSPVAFSEVIFAVEQVVSG